MLISLMSKLVKMLKEVELPAQASEADITAAIGSFNSGSSAGLGGLRPAHLKYLISRSAGEVGVRLVTALTVLVNQVILGELPAVARPAFFGATLTRGEKVTDMVDIIGDH